MLALPRHWMIPLAVGVACVFAWAIPWIEADRFGWLRGTNMIEPWRLLSAHLLHLDLTHLGMNLLGLALGWALVGSVWRTRIWIAALLLLALVISAGLHLASQVAGYVGLSGWLHAMVAFGAVGLWPRWRLGAALTIAFLVGKAVAEWWWPSAVIVEAHWVGTGAGLMLGIMAALALRRSR